MLTVNFRTLTVDTEWAVDDSQCESIYVFHDRPIGKGNWLRALANAILLRFIARPSGGASPMAVQVVFNRTLPLLFPRLFIVFWWCSFKKR